MKIFCGPLIFAMFCLFQISGIRQVVFAQMSSKEARPAHPLPLENLPQLPSLREQRDVPITPEIQLSLEEALRRKEYEIVESQLVKLIEQDPKAPVLLTFLARVFFMDGQHQNAAVTLQKAERLEPLKESDQYLLALCWIVMKKNDWAKLGFEKLASAHPGNPLYPYWKGRMEYDDYKYEAAIGYLKKALELDPEYAAAYDTLGLCYEEMSDSPSALANYEKATQFNRKKTPSSPWPPVNYAALLMKNNRIEEAEGLLKEALGYSSGMPQAHYQLGLVMEKQKKFPEALGALEKAAAHDAAFPDPHFAMMRIYRQLGEKEKGEREMKIFQQLKQAQKMKEHPMMQSDLTMH